MNNTERMYEMLKYRRPHRSKTERKFIQRFVSSLGDCTYDRIGNRIIRIGDAPILYSCHTDSVHRQPGLQNVAIKGFKFKLHRKENSNCLGADNAAGVWILTEMIRAKKPGLYIFHRGEEVGGVGSGYIAKYTPELVKDMKAAIAFDRRDTKSIITFQGGARCCSDEFADSLALELNLNHEKDRGGSFTDTKNYTDLIPECTNVSVGFDREHCFSETLDMAYLLELRQSMIEMDWEKLVIKRKAGDYESKWPAYKTYSGNTPSYSSGKKRWRYVTEVGDWCYYDKATGTWIKDTPAKVDKPGTWEYDKANKELVYHRPVGFLEHIKPESKQGSLLPDGHELGEEELPRSKNVTPLIPRQIEVSSQEEVEENRATLVEMVRNNPRLIAQLLTDYGATAEDVADFLHTNNGIVPPEMYGAPRADDETDPLLI